MAVPDVGVGVGEGEGEGEGAGTTATGGADPEELPQPGRAITMAIMASVEPDSLNFTENDPTERLPSVS